MIKKFLAVATLSLALCGTAAYAEDYVPTNGLTEVQKADLAIQAAKMRADKTDPKNTVEQVSAYVSIGKELGSGLAATAKEMGVAVNDFAGTPVGKFAMVMIAWKLLGVQVFQIVASIFFMLLALPFWAWAFRKYCIISRKQITYRDKNDVNGPKKVVQYEYHDNRGEQIGWFCIILLVIIGISSIMAFA